MRGLMESTINEELGASLEWCDSQSARQETRSDHERSEISSENARFFKMIVNSQAAGTTSLPATLGLDSEQWDFLAERDVADRPAASDEEDVRQTLLELRRDEWQELVDLMLRHRSDFCESELLMAPIVAAACLGSEHLWRDLGMTDRSELSVLLHVNFRPLSEKNTRDMKWKRFLYKQLCEEGGHYVCRAPSCDECTSFDECFGPED